MSKSGSRYACFHLLNAPKHETPLLEQNLPLNSPTHAEAGVLKMVVTSASEAKSSTAYVNEKVSVRERRTLEEMGNPQVAIIGTPLEMDNRNRMEQSMNP